MAVVVLDAAPPTLGSPLPPSDLCQHPPCRRQASGAVCQPPRPRPAGLRTAGGAAGGRAQADACRGQRTLGSTPDAALRAGLQLKARAPRHAQVSGAPVVTDSGELIANLSISDIRCAVVRCAMLCCVCSAPMDSDCTPECRRHHLCCLCAAALCAAGSFGTEKQQAGAR